MSIVGCSVDRRAADALTTRYNDAVPDTEPTRPNLSAPICFRCARILPFDDGGKTGPIKWRTQSLDVDKFAGTRAG